MMETPQRELHPADFRRFSEIVHQHSGIHLASVKTELLRSRLAKRMRALSIDSFRDYYQTVLEDPTGEELDRLLRVIGWSRMELAALLKCSETLARKWAGGAIPIPDRVAKWLARVAAAIERLPAPDDWRERERD